MVDGGRGAKADADGAAEEESARVVLRSGTPHDEAAGVDEAAAPSSASGACGAERETASAEADEEPMDAAPVARQ